ncbi:VOC family protein [Streptomyces sp. NBRC 109706]|uniref:VOC family protein n=1 Tax=Streptomyces sp. NBRC 109706 TaxID=1550035 RepID=UPI000781579C|nr:VOC family protein [Streptomyces sp. NBRC 109706]
MPAAFNHTIVASRDREESARFFRELFELEDAPSWGPFVNLRLEEGVLFQFAEPPVEEIQPQHYAFQVDEEQFDRTYARIRERNIEHWADPRRTRSGEINNDHGGRGVYFLDPAGHYIEMLTGAYV